MKENEMRLTITIPRDAFGNISPGLLKKLFSSVAPDAMTEVVIKQSEPNSVTPKARPTPKQVVKSITRHK